ncbi:MAG: ABC transporter permease [Rhodospirillales bacterium]
MTRAMLLSPWRGVRTVFVKEVVDNARDHRSLLSALIYPLLGPILLGLLFSAIVKATVASEDDAPMIVPISGMEHAPGLIEYLESQDLMLVAAPADAERAVQIGEVRIALIIHEGFDDAINADATGAVTAIFNSSNLPGLLAVSRLKEILGGYNRAILDRRLEVRGVEQSVLHPVTIVNVNVATEKNVIGFLFLMVPPLIIFNIFMGGVYLAMDTTSGERERGTLESLMVHPVPRWGLLLGKYLAALLFTVAAVAVQLLAFKLVLYATGTADLDFAQRLSWPALGLMLIVSVPLMMVAVGIQVIIASLTRTYKEAQTYLGLLPLIPAIPGMVLVFAPIHSQTWMTIVPILSQTLILGDLVSGDPVSPVAITLSALGSIAVASLFVSFASWLYEQERLVFGS